MCELAPESALRLVFPGGAAEEPDASPRRRPARFAHRAIGAALDAVLGERGAPIEDHDLADVALAELLDVITRSGALAAAVVDDDPASGPALRLCHDGPVPSIEPDALELVQAAFPVVHLREGLVRVARATTVAAAHLATAERRSTSGEAEVPHVTGSRYGRSAEELLLHLEVPVDVTRLPVVRLVVRRALPVLDAEDGSLFYGAMTEILTNAIEAHQRAGLATPVRVELPVGAPRVVVLDDGGGFDPARLPAGDLGRGLAIARAVCPGLRISSTSTGTEVVLPLPTVAP